MRFVDPNHGVVRETQLRNLRQESRRLQDGGLTNVMVKAGMLHRPRTVRVGGRRVGPRYFRLWGWATSTSAPTSRRALRASASLCSVCRNVRRLLESRRTAAPLYRVATAHLWCRSPPSRLRDASGSRWGGTLADRAGINPAGSDSASPDPHGDFEIALFDSDTTVATAPKATASAGVLIATLRRPLRWSSACPPLPADHPMRTVLACRDGGAAPIRRQLGRGWMPTNTPSAVDDQESSRWYIPSQARLSPHRCFSSSRRCGSSPTRGPSLYCECH